MKYNSNKRLSNFLIIVSLVMFSLPALALKDDTTKEIHIDSDQQALDMEGNKVTFTGNVIVKQGTIDIRAEKVVVTRVNGQEGKETIEAFGNPVTFYQLQDNGKPINGRGQKMFYDLAKDLVELTGNAYIEQLDSNVKGDRITYLVQQQQMQAYSDKGKRVKTVLVPAQLQDKQPGAKK